jgi:hypothetical protein
MHETRADVLALQALLDPSNAAAGPHSRSVFTEPRHLDAVTLTELLVGAAAPPGEESLAAHPGREDQPTPRNSAVG